MLRVLHIVISKHGRHRISLLCYAQPDARRSARSYRLSSTDDDPLPAVDDLRRPRCGVAAKRGADHLDEAGIDVGRLFEVGAGAEVDDELAGADLDPLA